VRTGRGSPGHGGPTRWPLAAARSCWRSAPARERETPNSSAASRAVRGVDGLTVEPDYLTGVYKNMRHGIVALVFRCHIVSGQPSPTAEASEVAWLTPAQVAELMNEAYATRLLDALQSGPPSVRIHDGVALLPS
jgi:8-oxo-dGTP diphosphatase